jgi:hypothetical protein
VDFQRQKVGAPEAHVVSMVRSVARNPESVTTVSQSHWVLRLVDDESETTRLKQPWRSV